MELSWEGARARARARESTACTAEMDVQRALMYHLHIRGCALWDAGLAAGYRPQRTLTTGTASADVRAARPREACIIASVRVGES